MQELLKKSEKFCDKDGNIFVLNVLQAIEDIDTDLVKLLLRDTKAKEQFFTKVEDVFVLNQNKLIEFFTMNEFSKNSYTSYTNKIGLIKKDSFIKKFDDVVLAWPHKDCILEGGQSKDDDKKNEVFYNEILSREEIDRLFEPKALTNIKKFSLKAPTKVTVTSGSEALASPLAVEQSTPTEITENDNLIIKGNNLIALHSLKKKFAGKVKLIYIDPPYNTGNDSFKYNDRFNHSTWLTFMKNRLEVAREFLSEDGVIFVQCDDNEQAYLKVLMDEIFGRENFISTFIVKSNPRGRQTSKLPLALTHEYITSFSNKNQNVKIYETKITENLVNEYKLEDEKGLYRLLGLRKRGTASNRVDRPNLYYEIYYDIKNKTISKIKSENCISILPLKEDRSDGVWRWQKSKVEKDKELLFVKEVKRRTGEIEYDVFVKDYLNNEGIQKGIKTKSILDDKHFNNEFGTEHIKNLFDKKIFDYPKSEFLIERIIEISTQENDLIMDFHLGSGTTCAVAHKMNRHYIGIEQMDYIEDIAVERMKKVIEGEQGGISKALNWQGGGSFIYAELKQIDTFKDAEIGKLNYNMYYLPFAEIEDTEYVISEEEIAINKKFYTTTGTSGLCDE
ncbi:MAG: site-specific DNA-methyltransferase [Sulfurimonas sp.]|nr:site-specific DNA-methyltransferase [Sulfurimonas sp.]